MRPASLQDMVITLPAATDCSATGAVCTEGGRKLSNTTSVTVQGPPNQPATGAPTITGAAQVGETLTADTSGISDADGLAKATFSYQWLVDDADVSGAASTTYTLVAADEGKAVKARVSFTDDAGNKESLTSAATAAVTAAPQPNRAPVIVDDANQYAQFVGTNNAPRGILVSKVFEGIFSDPDGDSLTYTVTIPADPNGLVDTVYIQEDIQRVFIQLDAEGDWGTITPALADPLVTTVTLTATDPGGLSASVTGEFHTLWAGHPILERADSVGAVIRLTFDQAMQAEPGPATEQFTAKAVREKGSTETIAVDSVAVTGRMVTLDLASALPAGLVITLDYVHKEATPLRRAAGGGDPAPSFTDRDVDSLSLPNIILIMADDLGYGDLGSYGQATIKTPELDAMAAAGMRFTDFYSGHTVCPPSREALLTGFHTGHTGLRGGKWRLDSRFCSARTTIGHMLQSAGYRTAVIGKWGFGGEGLSVDQPNNQGFDYFYGFLSHAHAHNSYPDMLFRNKDEVKLDNVLQLERKQLTGGVTDPDGRVEYSQDLFMEEALKFIEETSDTGQPFFLYLPVTLPHANSSAPEGGVMETPPDGYGQYADESWSHAQKSYAALVSYLDKDVGRLLDILEELGISNNTVTFFTSDNGPHSEGGYDPQAFNSSGPFSGGKRSLEEGGIRVPLIAHWPGSITAGGVSDHVSAAWDFMPTLAQIADAPAPEGGDGVSMLPTITGEGEQTRHEYPLLEQGGRGPGGRRGSQMGQLESHP